MNPNNLSWHLVRAFAPPRLRAGVLVTLALFSAACGDSASRMLSPSRVSSSSSGGSTAASNFAVLAGTAVTCTNSAVIGDVGVYPGTAVTQTNCTISGAVHAGDGVAKQAFQAFLARYDAVAAIPCTGVLNTAYVGVTVTLTPGVYCNAAAVTFTNSTLILDAQGDPNAVFIFKIGTSGIGALTGTNFSVVLAGGAAACNVTWWVAQAATLTDNEAGVPHPFVGTILAGTAITITGAITDRITFSGNVFAKTAVTMTDTNLTGCAGGRGTGNGKEKCNQGVGNGPEGCDPGNSNNHNPSNDENGGTPGNPGRRA